MKIAFGYFATFRQLSVIDISHLFFADVPRNIYQKLHFRSSNILMRASFISITSKPYVLRAGSETNTFSEIDLISNGPEGNYI